MTNAPAPPDDHAEASDDDGGLIRVMPETLANKIAAGEVVQRPASVAKELMENAVDAGAAVVELVLKDAGSTLVQVIDDGSGMSADDAVRCFQRHATSKIRAMEDLERIRTLGFRGEALASIAAVAQVELKTKRPGDPVGTRVVVEGGETTTVEPCATPGGTNLAVRNLFFNVPARRNFLKTPATELKHLTETFQFIALPQSRVAFRCRHNGHTLYDLPAADAATGWHDALRRRVVDLLGTRHEGALLDVDAEGGGLTVRGLVATPSRQRKTRGEQFLFVNDRYVRDRYLSHAVRTAYGDLLPDGAFPFFALFLALDPRRVDVNVHPTKAEVKFDDEGGVYSFLREAVRQALRRTHLTPDFGASGEGNAASGDAASGETDAPRPFRLRPSAPEDEADADASGSGPTTPRPFVPRGVDGGRPGASAGGARSASRTDRQTDRQTDRRSAPWRPPGDVTDDLYRPPERTSSDETGADAQDDAASGWMDESGGERPLWSLHGVYLVTPTDEGVMLIDQRAAHARILYERALGHLAAEAGESQQLLFAHTVELPPADVPLFEEIAPDLRALGFEAELLSGHTVMVRGVPADVPAGREQALLEEVLEAYKAAPGRAGGERAATKRRQHLARLVAQQGAIRRGQPLAPPERRALVRDLFACEMPYADPGGQPTILRLSLDELAARFRRQ